MDRLLVKLALTLVVASLLYPTRVTAQESPTTEKAASVRITRGPEVERADPDFAIIRWTSNNPGGSPMHYAIVRYGTDPTNLSQTAKSPIRLNSAHSKSVFRVHMENLKPRTTYYYVVDSMEASGRGDGVKSRVRHFTTP